MCKDALPHSKLARLACKESMGAKQSGPGTIVWPAGQTFGLTFATFHPAHCHDASPVPYIDARHNLKGRMTIFESAAIDQQNP
jgi:hypothetical protein